MNAACEQALHLGDTVRSHAQDGTLLAALPLTRAFFFKMESLLPGYLECILLVFLLFPRIF